LRYHCLWRNSAAGAAIVAHLAKALQNRSQKRVSWI
jgi:hypothetical protein